MASETQTCAIGILANRRNARKSTGPRTNRLSSPAKLTILTKLTNEPSQPPRIQYRVSSDERQATSDD
ncbi:hypothetical protein ES703_26505 [subsurface metagenome]